MEMASIVAQVSPGPGTADAWLLYPRWADSRSGDSLAATRAATHTNHETKDTLTLAEENL